MDHYKFFCNRECEYFPCHKGVDPEHFNCLCRIFRKTTPISSAGLRRSRSWQRKNDPAHSEPRTVLMPFMASVLPPSTAL